MDSSSLEAAAIQTQSKVTLERQRTWRCIDCSEVGVMSCQEEEDVSSWYERQVCQLLSRSGLTVQRYPRIDGSGPNPDWLFTQHGGPDCIVECTVVFQNREHTRQFYEQGFHVCGGDIRDSCGTIYESLRRKMVKYRKLVGERAYVVAVRDETCGNWPPAESALFLAFSAQMRTLTIDLDDKGVEVGWKDAWSGEQTEGLLRRFPHCSGILYSADGTGHFFVSNPNAEVPIASRVFEFASIPKRQIQGSGEIPLERGPTMKVTGEPRPHRRAWI